MTTRPKAVLYLGLIGTLSLTATGCVVVLGSTGCTWGSGSTVWTEKVTEQLSISVRAWRRRGTDAAGHRRSTTTRTPEVAGLRWRLTSELEGGRVFLQRSFDFFLRSLPRRGRGKFLQDGADPPVVPPWKGGTEARNLSGTGTRAFPAGLAVVCVSAATHES